ncbi:hypothetical protein PILCRDRAFT_148677 [Piloderma croceum F 1598]|uniref:Uncharacterized protein n=1 Tax=Piloderma croceum (strain F 1598) TaxID=765440 RepID=A0A0C3G3E8_PILCF|nr:hypothetical protein PILCRDRAFT_148677 [Piloderma croceum F 1598]
MTYMTICHLRLLLSAFLVMLVICFEITVLEYPVNIGRRAILQHTLPVFTCCNLVLCAGLVACLAALAFVNVARSYPSNDSILGVQHSPQKELTITGFGPYRPAVRLEYQQILICHHDTDKDCLDAGLSLIYAELCEVDTKRRRG